MEELLSIQLDAGKCSTEVKNGVLEEDVKNQSQQLESLLDQLRELEESMNPIVIKYLSLLTKRDKKKNIFHLLKSFFLLLSIRLV